MPSSRTRRFTLASTACAMALTLSACGGDGTGDANGEGTDKKSSGPVTLELWTDKEAAKTAAAAFNAAHKGVRIKVVIVPEQDMVNNVSNAHKAGDASKMPCLVSTSNRNGGMFLGQGIAKDITELVKPYESKYAENAFVNLSIGGQIYAVPSMRQPIFTLAHEPTFTKYKIDYPGSWDEVIAAGEKLKKHDVKVFNLAGEDPSTFMNLAWQGGARWYKVEGDAWKINFTDGASKNAARVMQDLLDKDLVAKISYADYPAMMREYDTGKIAMRQVSTWQLSSFQQNLKTTLGQWEPHNNLTVPGQSTPLSAADTSGYVVSELCESPEAAVEAAAWLTTEAAPIKAMADPAKGNGWFPAVADPKPYMDAVVPKKLMGDHAAKAVPTIIDNSTFAEGWVYGPNSTAMYEELADQWGKAMNGDLTVDSILSHMQKWTVDDLKRRGISVAE